MTFWNLKRSTIGMAVAASALCAAGTANAELVTINVADIFSMDEYGDADNVRLTQASIANGVVKSVFWSVTIYADAPSFLSEIGVDFSNTDGSGSFYLTPGVGANFSSSTALGNSFSGSMDLGGFEFVLNADGLLNIEFFELFDDYANEYDGQWLAGTLQLDVRDPSTIPEPASYGLAALALMGVAVTSRRRKQPADKAA